MNTKNTTEKDREILVSVKKEMAMPRLAASVRDDQEAVVAPFVKARVAHTAKA